MTKQEQHARHKSFYYIREMKKYNKLSLAHQVIIVMWINNMITYNTKCNLIKWLYA